MSPKKDSEFDFHTPPTFTYAGHTLDQEQFDEMLQDVSRTLAKGDPIVVVVDSDYEVQKNPTVLLNCVAAGDGGENFHGENQASVKREEMQRQEFPSRFGYSSKKRLLEPQGTPEQIMNDALSKQPPGKKPRYYMEDLSWTINEKSTATKNEEGTATPSFIRESGGCGYTMKRKQTGHILENCIEELQPKRKRTKSFLSTTNFVKGTLAAQSTILHQELAGVTYGSPVLATAGAGTVLHKEQLDLESCNALFYGWKAWFLGDGLVKWREQTGGASMDPIAKDVLEWPTVKECVEHGILVVYQKPGTTVCVGSAVVHTVMSLTFTIAEATNLRLNGSLIYSNFIGVVKEYMPLWYTWENSANATEADKHSAGRLARYFKHSADMLRVVAYRVSEGNSVFAKLPEDSVVDLAPAEATYAVYALKRGENLVYLLAVRRGENRQRIHNPQESIQFCPNSRKVIPQHTEGVEESVQVALTFDGQHGVFLSKGVFEKASGKCLVLGKSSGPRTKKTGKR